MTFNPDLPVQTRDGRKARIICTDMMSRNSIVAAVLEGSGKERLYVYGTEGIGPHGSASFDLINIPEKRWAVLLDDFTWVQTYSEMSPGKIIPTSGPKVKCIACIKFTEGDGLK